MARKLAAKVSLSTRFDALCDESIGNQIGFDARVYLESQLKNESERGPKRISGQGKKFGTPGSAGGGNYKFKRLIFRSLEWRIALLKALWLFNQKISSTIDF